MAETIPSFETLYKRSNMGDRRTVEWQVWIEPGAGGAYDVVCEYGYQECKKVQHRKQVPKGKAKRTVLEQAYLEAKSKWNEKHDREGYRTSLGEEADGDETATTASTAPMRPMLAHTYTAPTAATSKSKAYKMPFPCYLQRKLDGIRCISRPTTDGTTIVMESRKGTDFVGFDHIRMAIRNLYDNLELALPKDLHFDGELYTDELPFETVSGLVRQKKENKKTANEDRANMLRIQYHIYDVYIPSHAQLTFEQRLAFLERIAQHIPLNSALKLVHTERAQSYQEVKAKHDQYVAEGFEGIMLRDPIGIYESNKRSKFLQKYKEFMEEEFRIVGYHDGEGIDAGLVIWECELPDGRIFSVKPRGTHEYRRQLFEDAEHYVGEKLTVIFQEYSADGVPRFPVGKSVRTDI
jgi:ATP-dependent DNA ligase